MIYFFLAAFLVTIGCTLLIRKIAIAINIVDRPDGKRKLHLKPIPLLGGVALFFSFWTVVFYIAYFTNLFSKQINLVELWGIFLGSLLIVLMGVADDKYSLPVWLRFVVTMLAVFIVLFMGVELDKITNPLGGVIKLDSVGLYLSWINVAITIGDFLVFIWLMGMMYTTKILDGLDGLATGIAMIGGFMIFFLTQTKKFFQPDVGLVALIFAGVCLGFLIFNFHPAKIFLGEGGSLFIGFILGILAVISGGKIATALLVMAIPILDLIRVIYLRIRNHRHVFEGDREHLHFRLRDAGFSERGTVLFLYAVAFIFGLTTLFLQSKAKLVTLAGLAVVMCLVGIWLKQTRLRKM